MNGSLFPVHTHTNSHKIKGVVDERQKAGTIVKMESTE
jgi:hypothetical protein